MIHKVGERLSSYRKDRKMSQEELASVLHVTRQTISKWETGDTLPDMYNAVALANLFHVTLDHLIMGSVGRMSESSYYEQLKDKRKKINLRAIIVGSTGSTSFLVFLVLFKALGIDTRTIGIAFAIIIPFLFACWLFAIWGFINTSRINEEIKYLERLEIINLQMGNTEKRNATSNSM